MFNVRNAPKAIRESSGDGFTIRAADNELLIMDDIGKDLFGDGIAAPDVKRYLTSRQGQPVTARFNSYGGDAFEGVSIHNAFQEHGNVTARIEGIAFSAAAIAAAGAKRLVMNEASSFGIHRSWSAMAGNSKAFRAAIEWLDSVDRHQIEMFAARSGNSRDQVEAWLDGTDDGTIFSAQEALDHGFADEVLPLKKRQAAEGQHAYALMLAKLRMQRLTT